MLFLTLSAAEPLQGGDEPAVQLGRPAPPGLPLLLRLRLLVLALRSVGVRDGAAGGARSCGGRRRRGRQGQVRDRRGAGELTRRVDG